MKYHKIQTVFKREPQKPCRIIEGDWTQPEFDMLKDIQWEWTEKIDGTNIRVVWEGKDVTFEGRTDDSQIPIFLYTKLAETFPSVKMKKLYPDSIMTLFGEGYGNKIQKAGKDYIEDGCSFILFDVYCGGVWLDRKDVEDIADKLGIKAVQVVGRGTLNEAIEYVRTGFESKEGKLKAEGLVLRPPVELLDKQGHRIITKIKHVDFN